MSIAVIAGLGNPGSKYRNTRHNIGFALVEKLAAKLGAEWKTEARFEAEIATVSYEERKLLLVKPQCFMNASGRSLGAILRYRKLPASSLVAIYDDITLELSRPKLSLGGSAGGHNGITDLLAQIGAGFLRYRIGIGAKPHKEMDLADYVLSKFSKDEQKLLADRNPTYLEHLQLIIDKEPEHAMNFINQRTAP
jgi:PTH1 family peptidyl-tRNA hydrolase|tara:strand:- start:1242 stop:1823 length:582 start_codon:yes stop_codon:yes gene_type:complete